ncbi:MAG: YajQ family cyclic di-GMP-binding protein [candidate division NC10 bacterium]|nr:YajQ family cyclic di-GMP-binding protein [candidate division NC10 bacterium]MBI2116003.1 YajQ family cyclic di-GMP-binding protein [candidate division NC10 bacterium]MBI2455959.1 YajQ family cyclic di-GMP-binding protein [candidate division NC10 bacterium]
MASECSFDIASKVDLQEVDNAMHQTTREIGQRFDFKGSVASVTREEHALLLTAEDEFKLKQMLDILEGKLVKRQVPLKALSRGKVESARGGQVRQRLEFQQGIPLEKARELVKLIKGTKLKVQAQIQEDQVRVFGRDKDQLQAVIQFLREQDLGVHMQFTNYRS